MQIDFDKGNKKRNLTIVVIALGMIVIVLLGLYVSNKNFRTFFDRYLLMKEVTENGASSIDIGDIDNPSIYAFDKYVTILNKNKLSLYTSINKREYEFDVNISDALYASNDRFLIVAENNGQKLYQIADGNIMWQQEIEGQIQKVNVNKNGYVSVIIGGSSYKTIIEVYTPQGKELFKTYLSSTSCIDTSISNDNKYMSIAEINTSGTLVQSSIKIVSIEKAQTDPTNSIIETHDLESDILVKNVQYQDKNYLVSMYDDGIRLLHKEQEEELISFTSNKVTFASIKLNNYIVYSVEKSSGLFNNNTQISMKNVTNGKENIYIAEGTLKEIKTNDNHIAINLGSEIHFITTNGWLTKKYTSEKEVKDIVLGDKIAGIVYKDKIDVINL